MLQLAFQRAGQPKRARPADIIGELIGYQILVNSAANRLRVHAGRENRFLGVAQNLPEQHGLELPAELRDFFSFRKLCIAAELFDRQISGLHWSLEMGKALVASSWCAPSVAY